MPTSLVLTVIAPDHPGLVERFADVIARHGGNWEAGRLVRLAGSFAGVVHVTAADEVAPALAAELRALADSEAGATVVVRPAGGPRAESPGRLLRVEVVGADHPGIVRAVSAVLTERAVNVEELDTNLSPAPMSGEAFFHAEALVRVPSTVAVSELSAALEALADDLSVHVEDEG